MGEISTVGFNEDIDLNAGAATIAAISAGMLNCTLDDADTIKLPEVEGMYIKAIRWHDETAAGTGGYLHFPGYNAERKYRFGKDALTGDLLTGELIFPDNYFMLPKGQTIKCVGDASGSGAEQHTVLLDIYFPHLPSVSKYAGGKAKEILMVGKKTGTLVANSLTGLVKIHTAFEDSEPALAEDKDARYGLMRLGAYPSGAGYGILGVRHQNGMVDRLFPAMITAVKGVNYPIGWLFDGDAAPKTVGCGVGTTSSEMTLEIAKFA